MKRLIFVLGFLLLLCATNARAACSNTSLGNGVTCVQSVAVIEGGTGTTLACTLPSNPTAGNMLLAVSMHGVTSGNTATFADAVPETFNIDRTQTDGTTGLGRITIGSFPNTAGGANAKTITATLSGTNGIYWILICAELSGVQTSTPFDKAAGQDQGAPGTGANAVTSGNTAALASQPQLIIGASVNYIGAGQVTTAGTSPIAFTMFETKRDSNNGNWLDVEGATVASTSAVAATFTQGTAGGTTTAVTTYKASGGGAAVVPTLMLRGIGPGD